MDGEGSDYDNRTSGRIKGFDKRQQKNCGYYFKKLDYEILRPLFIYDYERSKMKKEDEMVQQILADAPIIGTVYSKVQVRGNSINEQKLKNTVAT